MSYVHKLLSGRTYGAKSQESSESRLRVPSASAHPLLLPPVLDIIFPFLPLNNLKNCRLVCSTWNAVGIPVIARRKLHPVEFSAISHQDFLALKTEFLKFPSKVKLFQGFRFKWEEINTMVWSNFIASFKPRALFTSDRDVTDPWTNLVQILLPASTSLTHLSLEVYWDSLRSCPNFTSLFNNLAALEPLKLKSLCLKFDDYEDGHNREILHNLIQALEKFFQSQSSTLEELELAFDWYISGPNSFRLENLQFHLPIFQCLRSLDLHLYMMTIEGDYLPIFAPFDFNDKFPQLVQMKLLDSVLFKLEENAIHLTRGHPLKKLETYGCAGFEYGEMLPALYSSFPYLEELIAPTCVDLEDGGREILWAETLRILDVAGLDFDFRHLKRLEDLKYFVYKDEEHIEFHIASMIDLISDHLHQLPHLKSFHLTFQRDYMTREKMEEIQEGIPAEFRAILTLSLPYPR